MEALYSGDHSVTDQLFATDLSRIMWPFIGFASLSALVMGALNMVGVFGLPMLASAAFNVTSIVLGLLIGWFIDPSFGPKALYGFALRGDARGHGPDCRAASQTPQNGFPLEAQLPVERP